MKLNLKTVKHCFMHGLGTGSFRPPAPVRAIEVVGRIHRNGETQVIGIITREMFTDVPHKKLKWYIGRLHESVNDPKFRDAHFIVRTYGDVYTYTMEVPKS